MKKSTINKIKELEVNNKAVSQVHYDSSKRIFTVEFRPYVLEAVAQEILNTLANGLWERHTEWNDKVCVAKVHTRVIRRVKVAPKAAATPEPTAPESEPAPTIPSFTDEEREAMAEELAIIEETAAAAAADAAEPTLKRTEPVRTDKNVIVWENGRQLILWNEELCGQISDGYWENTRPHDHWEIWCRAEAMVAAPHQLTGRNFYAQKDNYNLNAKVLLECVGDRMVEAVQAKYPGYDMRWMRKDLAAMKKIMKQQFRS